MRRRPSSSLSLVGLALGVSSTGSGCGGLFTYDSGESDGLASLGNISAGGAWSDAEGAGEGDGGAESDDGSSDGVALGTGGRVAGVGTGGTDTGGASSDGTGGEVSGGAGGSPLLPCDGDDVFDHDSDPTTACAAKSDCAPGSFVSDAGDASTDRQCTDCPPESFSIAENAAECTTWTECTPPETEEAPGTSISDRTCRPWTVQVGTAGFDRLTAVAVDHDGYVIVAGNVEDALTGQTHAGKNDAFVRKYDRFGSEVWTRQFGSNDDDYAKALSVDAPGNIYVSGLTEGSVTGQSSNGEGDAFLRKYDPAGTEVWTRQFGGVGRDGADATISDSFGHLYVCGSIRTSLTGDLDAFLRTYDWVGNVLDEQVFGSDDDDYCSALALDESGDLFLLGPTKGAIGGQNYFGAEDFFLRRQSLSQGELWTRQEGTARQDAAYAVDVDGDGNVYLAGETSGEIPEEDWESRDSLLNKYDTSGTLLWSMRSRVAGEDFAASLQVDDSSHVFLVGFGERPERHTSIRKYDANGVELWAQDIADAHHPHASALDGDGYLYVVGGTYKALPGHTNSGAWDGFLIRIAP